MYRIIINYLNAVQRVVVLITTPFQAVIKGSLQPILKSHGCRKDVLWCRKRPQGKHFLIDITVEISWRYVNGRPRCNKPNFMACKACFLNLESPRALMIFPDMLCTNHTLHYKQ